MTIHQCYEVLFMLVCALVVAFWLDPPIPPGLD